jgi:transcriptional regulator GlxA family with amidase domain
VLVPGGIDPSGEMRDDDVMSWLRTTGKSAEYVTAVCTGSLILAEAGLLDGYKATTHWAFRKQLASYPGVELGGNAPPELVAAVEAQFAGMSSGLTEFLAAKNS